MIEAGCAAALPLRQHLGPPGGHVFDRQRRPSRLQERPGVGTRAVYLLPGELSADEVLARMGDGLLVQSVSGLHSGVNPVSGDFSVGAEGLLFQDGELAAPVREADDSLEHPAHAPGRHAVGNDLEWLPSPAAGVTLAISRNVDERGLKAASRRSGGL